MTEKVCQLCERVPKKGTTAHHLIPRTCHRNKWFQRRFSREEMRRTVDLCRDCHHAVHQFVPREKDLGRNYYTLDLIRAHPMMARHIDWVRKQR
ncbi:MAG: hypothetical protein ACE361_05075 [Aureliella sp.]